MYVIFCTHSPASYPIDMLNVLCTMISRSMNDNSLRDNDNNDNNDNDNSLRVHVYSIYKFMANSVGPINNVSLVKSIALAKSHSYMRIALLTKFSYNGTKK